MELAQLFTKVTTVLILFLDNVNFNIPLPPPFCRDIWDYKNTNKEMILKAIVDFNWKRAFSINSVNESVPFCEIGIKKYIQCLHTP